MYGLITAKHQPRRGSLARGAPSIVPDLSGLPARSGGCFAESVIVDDASQGAGGPFEAGQHRDARRLELRPLRCNLDLGVSRVHDREERLPRLLALTPEPPDELVHLFRVPRPPP